jgi:site-specific DNA-methyltransferase (adenine-specific)
MITITNEDNMELMARYPDKYFDLAIVDPPYGLGDSVVNSGGRFKRYHNKNGNWDNSIPTNEYFNELFRVSKNQIIWGGNYFNLPKNKCFIIWDKQQPEGVSFAMAEYAWASFDSVAKIFKKRTQGQENRFHPTQKPVALYKWILDKYAKQGDKILDTHLGSGSIAIACHDYGFDLTACELDKEYYNAALRRLNDHQLQQKLF